MNNIRKVTKGEIIKAFNVFLDTDQAKALPDPIDMDHTVTLWTQLLDADLGVGFVVAVDEQIVGVICGTRGPDVFSGTMVARENAFYIHPDHRKYGAELLHAFENWAEEKGCKHVVTCACSVMPKGVGAFFKRKGYEVQDTLYRKEL